MTGGDRASRPILVVDDDAASRRALVATLQRWDWNVVEARSGGEALAEMGRGRFSAMLTDLHMPGLDGYAVVRHLRARERREGAEPMPVFAVSADVSEGVRAQCQRVGLTAVIAKPIAWDALWDLLASLTTHPMLGREAAESSEVSGLIEALLPVFFDSRRGDVEAMRGFLATEDALGLQRVGHTLKGCGGSYGFPRVTELGAQIEVAAARADFSSCQAMLEQLAQHLEEAEVRHAR